MHASAAIFAYAAPAMFKICNKEIIGMMMVIMVVMSHIEIIYISHVLR